VLLETLTRPIVAAPMGGGPTTPELVRAVGAAGGFGFLAAGYRSAEEVAAEVRALGQGMPCGVNLFVPGPRAEAEAYSDYVNRLGKEAGEPRWSDDRWGEKLAALVAEPVAVVSFTFGCPEAEVLGRLREAGSECWLTVTNVGEAEQSVAAGADVLIAQGYEAGAHQGTHDLESEEEPYGLLALLQLLRAEAGLPLVASGGIGSGAGVAACLAAGAAAVQLGTAFMLCPEAGTSEAHRQALKERRPTRLTRAFTGRRARGAVNRFLREHEGAPAAYPEVHYATAPIRAAARAAGDAEALNLWAGQAHWLAREEPAATVVDRFSEEARKALGRALQGLGPL
jgi:nitronate monooxygenase